MPPPRLFCPPLRNVPTTITFALPPRKRVRTQGPSDNGDAVTGSAGRWEWRAYATTGAGAQENEQVDAENSPQYHPDPSAIPIFNDDKRVQDGKKDAASVEQEAGKPLAESPSPGETASLIRGVRSKMNVPYESRKDIARMLHFRNKGKEPMEGGRGSGTERRADWDQRDRKDIKVQPEPRGQLQTQHTIRPGSTSGRKDIVAGGGSGLAAGIRGMPGKDDAGKTDWERMLSSSEIWARLLAGDQDSRRAQRDLWKTLSDPGMSSNNGITSPGSSELKKSQGSVGLSQLRAGQENDKTPCALEQNVVAIKRRMFSHRYALKNENPLLQPLLQGLEDRAGVSHLLGIYAQMILTSTEAIGLCDSILKPIRLRKSIQRQNPTIGFFSPAVQEIIFRAERQISYLRSAIPGRRASTKGLGRYEVQSVLDEAERRISKTKRNISTARVFSENIHKRLKTAKIPGSNPPKTGRLTKEVQRVSKRSARLNATKDPVATRDTPALVEELVKRLTKVEIDRYLKDQVQAQMPQPSERSSASELSPELPQVGDRGHAQRKGPEDKLESKRAPNAAVRVGFKFENCLPVRGTSFKRLEGLQAGVSDAMGALDSKSLQTMSAPHHVRQQVVQDLASTSSPEEKVDPETTSSPSTTDERSNVSLLEELFPETVMRAQASHPDAHMISGPNTPFTTSKPAYLIHKEATPPKPPQLQSHTKRLESLATDRNITPIAGTTTVLHLTNASPTLTPADFHRLIPRGAHIPHWSSPSTGSIARIVPCRDPLSLERKDNYYLFFTSPGAAFAYQKNASRIHKLATLHTPRSIFDAIPPPPGLLEEGENVHELVKSYALAVPGLRLHLNVVPPPFSDSLVALVREGGYRGVVGSDGEVGKRVLLKIAGHDFGRRRLYNAIKQDGFRRGVLWPMSGGLRGVMPLADIVGIEKLTQRKDSTGSYALGSMDLGLGGDLNATSDYLPGFDVNLDLGQGAGVGPEHQEKAFLSSTYVLKKKVHGKYVVEFDDEGAAKRFARAWRGVVVAKNEGLVSTRDGTESEMREDRWDGQGVEGRVVQTEVLW